MPVDGTSHPAPAAIYREADELLRETAGGDPSLGQLLAPEPRYLEAQQWRVRQDRFEILCSFFDTTLELFRAALRGDADPALVDLMLNDTPVSFGLEHHRSLGGALLTRPLFFRTDEAPDGTLYEVQCPGSGWGEYELLRDLYRRRGADDRAYGCFPPSLAERFVAEVSALGIAGAPILHLMDNSSSPAGVRYFIQRTRPRLAYYGWDPDIRSIDCGLVRSHSFVGLMAENFATRRLAAARAEGRPLFDLPPHVLFDQKTPFVLPFHPTTRDAYSDAVRACLPYTQLVTPNGFALPDGEPVTLERFASLPKGSRKCFLKYAGTDVAWNWGSQAVTRLSKASSPMVLEALETAARATEDGHPWVIQLETGDSQPVQWIDPERGEILSDTLNAKYSAFYGPRGLMTMSSWFRADVKVHSQGNAVQCICGGEPPR